MSSELDRQGLLDIFVMEAAEALAALSAAVNPPGDALPSPEELQNQYVWAHKIRGASGIYGFTGLSLLGELLETTLEQSTSIEPALWPKTVGILRGMVEAFQSQLEVVKTGGNRRSRGEPPLEKGGGGTVTSLRPCGWDGRIVSGVSGSHNRC